MSKISMDKNYVTRDGRKVTVLSISVNDPYYTVAALIHHDGGADRVGQFSALGRYYQDVYSDLDLREEGSYEPGEKIEVNTFLGWRPWYVYHSRLEEGIHLVMMEKLPSDRHAAEDRYQAVPSEKIRIRQE